MRRVSVVSSGPGAGKTTLARRLAALLGVPHVELDALFWERHWTPAQEEAFRARVAATAIRTHGARRRRFSERLAEPRHAGLEVIRLRSPREEVRWLAGLERSLPTSARA